KLVRAPRIFKISSSETSPGRKGVPCRGEVPYPPGPRLPPAPVTSIGWEEPAEPTPDPPRTPNLPPPVALAVLPDEPLSGAEPGANESGPMSSPEPEKVEGRSPE